MRLMKSSRIVILTAGRYAGRKAVIVKPYDEGTSDKAYGHALVVGIKDYPKQVTKSMGKKKIAKRSKIKPFVKIINYNHLLTTRFTIDLGLNNTKVNKDCFKDKKAKKLAKAEAKAKLEEK